MSTIQDDARSACDQLQSSRPDRGRQTVVNGIFGGITEGFGSGDGQGSVGQLVIADEGQAEVLVLEARDCYRQDVPVPASGCRFELDLVAKPPDRCTGFPGVLLNDLEGHAFAACDDVVSRLDDPRCLMSELLDPVDQILL